ncbi:MAG: RNA polymerase Rpb6 [Bacteroidia bacterium]|nr:DNA-directed RNA polymerase subunit omega [Bacteroidales bacterium]NCD41559.1 RNA polymerase Rpb6 [Bacteroidia bacterium]MDD2322330.1 DNA-directed RNA polymerase subunit omega [Bacteroidales bacterium]MDD3009884.1 DNA-directed RNA polymerase subunit omega [Bacteroidales bacterium]MDD3961469.1 DNA-directed RNA polymerase subunit omega [Bacteroidales bacterium]
MDYKRIKTDSEAVTRQMRDFDKETGNIYEAVAILAKRANQLGMDIKKELDQKIEEFATPADNLEEVFENREQIEIAKYYEQLPKPTLIAIHEFLNDLISYRNPHKENPEKKA